MLPIDVDWVLNNPIGISHDGDNLRWIASSVGLFGVPYAYRIAQPSREMASCSSGSDPVWRAVWGLNIPPKAKIFLWRALCDIFPNGVNLRSKGIEGMSRCSRCSGV